MLAVRVVLGTGDNVSDQLVMSIPAEAMSVDAIVVASFRVATLRVVLVHVD